jgi:hypothetical protein
LAFRKRQVHSGLRLHPPVSNLTTTAWRSFRRPKPVAAGARRATLKASASGTAKLRGMGELVEDAASGRVDLSNIGREAPR